MRRISLRLVLAAALVAVVTVVWVSGSAPAEEPTTVTEQSQPTVVKQFRKVPDRYQKRRVHFVPWSRARGYRQVGRIIAVEAPKWGASASTLHRRIACESGYDPTVVNGGGYGGLGQFANSTFWRGVEGMPHLVKFKRSSVKWRPTLLITRWSDGRVTKKRGYKVRVRRTRVYVGRIRNIDRFHTWAQVRIMAQANAGRGTVNDSEWSCR